MAETPDLDSRDAPSVAHPERIPRWRRVLVVVLVVLGCILAPLSALSVWMKTTLLDTDNYVATVAPMADNASVQNAIADRVTTTLVTNNNVEQRIVDRLPDKAKFVAPKIGDALESFVHDATLKIVQSDQFATLWKEANRRAHTQIVALLEGKGGDRLTTKNGEIALQLGPMIDKVNSALESKGIDAFSNAASANSDKQITLIDSAALKQSQTATDLLQKLAVVLPILTLLCFAIAIWLSPRRRRTILRSGLGFALGMAVLLIAFNGGRHFYLTSLPSRVNSAAAAAVYDQLLGALKLALRSAFAFGIIVALAAWLSGPARPATAMREGMLKLVRGKGAAGGDASPVALYVASHKNGLRVLVVAIGLVILVALSAPTPIQLLVIAVLVLVGILLIEFLGRRASAAPDTTT